MTPDRRALLTSLAVTVARRYRDASGEPQPHEIPHGVTEAVIIALNRVWGAKPSEISRLTQNIDAGIDR